MGLQDVGVYLEKKSQQLLLQLQIKKIGQIKKIKVEEQRKN